MLDDNIKQAISEAVAEENQTRGLAEKLISWIDSLIEGSEQISLKDNYKRRCEHCFDATISHDETIS